MEHTEYRGYVWVPVAVNVYYFVWKLLSAIYKFSFIHSYVSSFLNIVSLSSACACVAGCCQECKREVTRYR